MGFFGGGQCGRTETKAEQPHLRESGSQAVLRSSAAGTRDPMLSVLSLALITRPSLLVVSGFQSSFSSGLETLTLVASKLMLSLLCHHQGWKDGVQLSSGWKSPRNNWLSWILCLVLHRVQAPQTAVGAAGRGTVPRTCLFNHLSGKTFHKEWQKIFEGICLLLLSLLYGIPKAVGVS